MKILVLDQQFQGVPQSVASFLLEGSGGYLLLETGPSSSLPQIHLEMSKHGVSPDDVKAVAVTHIHLDHAGSCGWWAAKGCPVYVHQRGAKHLVDPSRLMASATRIYGDQMDTLWGEMKPVPEQLVRPLSDGSVVQEVGLELVAHDTPGHARHHMAFQLGTDLFSGDVAGVRLPGQQFLSVPAPPPEFDREAWKESLSKLRALSLERLYLTHFGQVDRPKDHFDRLSLLLDDVVAYFEGQQAEDPTQLAASYAQWDRARARDEGVDDKVYQAYEKANPSFMSVTGVLRYLQQRDVNVG